MAPKRAALFEKRSKAAKKGWRTRKKKQAVTRVETAYKAGLGPSKRFQRDWQAAGGSFIRKAGGWEAQLIVSAGADPADAIVGLSERWQSPVQREGAWASAQMVLSDLPPDWKQRGGRSNYYTLRGGHLYGPNPMRSDRFAYMIVGAIDMARIVEEERATAEAVVLRIAWGEKPNWRRKKR